MTGLALPPRRPKAPPREPLPSGYSYGYTYADDKDSEIVGPFAAPETARKRVDADPNRILMRCPLNRSSSRRSNWEEVPE